MQLLEIMVILGLIETVILFSYSARYYIFSLTVLFSGKKNEEPKNLDPNIDPFVSVMLPVYNEPNVINRLLTACTSFDYRDYEVIVTDDSADETTTKLERWKNHPRIKMVHRTSRTGWKGGALNGGLDQLDARSTHVLVLDADFVPPKDLIQRFLARFEDGKAVAVQGYQKHDLNSEENWLTRGVRVLYSIGNMVELNAKNKLKLFMYLTGSVFMIRTEILKNFRFEDDLTEDWNLSLRLYESGYKIIYDPTLTASGECPRTVFRFFRQNMRWAEGHTRNFRRHFFKILTSKYVTRREKIEFLFLGTFYLNSIYFIGLTIGGILMLPSLSHILSNNYVVLTWVLALMGSPASAISAVIALSSEGIRRQILRIPNALFLGYISTPIVAYAALKGLITNTGHFHRTYKTGKIITSND